MRLKPNLTSGFRRKTISQTYHARFRDIFAAEVKIRQAEFDAAGISYTYRLIDDAAASLAKDAGGFVLAMMNFDGDVWSDFIASAFGSLGLMTSVLCSPKGCWNQKRPTGPSRATSANTKKVKSPPPTRLLLSTLGAVRSENGASLTAISHW